MKICREGGFMEQVTHIGLSILGYNRQQVNQLIEQKEFRIRTLEQEVAEWEKKLTLLEERVQAYEAMEEELKAGILDARVTGKLIVEQSTKEATRIVEQTNEQAIQYKEDLTHQSRELVRSGASLKDRMNEMKQELLTIIQAYQKMVESTDFDTIYPVGDANTLSQKINFFESEELLTWSDSTEESAKKLTKPLTDEEKAELKDLIQDVITHEIMGEEVRAAVGESNPANSTNKKLVKFTNKKKPFKR